MNFLAGKSEKAVKLETGEELLFPIRLNDKSDGNHETNLATYLIKYKEFGKTDVKITYTKNDFYDKLTLSGYCTRTKKEENFEVAGEEYKSIKKFLTNSSEKAVKLEMGEELSFPIRLNDETNLATYFVKYKEFEKTHVKITKTENHKERFLKIFIVRTKFYFL